MPTTPHIALDSAAPSAFKPRDVRALVRATRGRRRGTLTDDQLPELVHMVLEPGSSPVVTYLGYAVRRA